MVEKEEDVVINFMYWQVERLFAKKTLSLIFPYQTKTDILMGRTGVDFLDAVKLGALMLACEDSGQRPLSLLHQTIPVEQRVKKCMPTNLLSVVTSTCCSYLEVTILQTGHGTTTIGEGNRKRTIVSFCTWSFF